MPVHDNGAYRTLCERFVAAGRLHGARISLFWDSMTYMPRGGAWARGEQLAAIDAARQDLIAAPDVDELLTSARAAAECLEPVERANLHEMQRLARHEAAVPKALMMAKAREVAKTQTAWVSARQANDFDPFAQAFGALM